MSERVSSARVRELSNTAITDCADAACWRHPCAACEESSTRRERLRDVAYDIAADLIDARDDIAARDRLLDLTERRCAEAMEESARLRAIVEGRTVPPTDEELREHVDAGGAWLVTIPARRQVRLHPETRYVDSPREASLLWWTEGARWVAVRDGRPCAWPAPREPAADVARDAPGAG